MADLLSLYPKVLEVNHLSDFVVKCHDAIVDKGEGLQFVKLGKPVRQFGYFTFL